MNGNNNIKENEADRELLDFAETVSSSVSAAESYMAEQGVDLDTIVQSGMDTIEDHLERSNKSEEPDSESLSKQQLYFRRVVLAAEIAKTLHREFTFGHVKFQKLMYLCEKICQYDLKERYSKQAAGPMDNKFMHTIDKEFKKQNWFDVTQEGKYKKYTYHPLEGLEKQAKYYEKYFAEHDEKIRWLLETFRSKRTNEVELIATIFACWEEAIDEGLVVSDGLLIQKVYQWSKEKKKYSRKEIIDSINWMRENYLFPDT